MSLKAIFSWASVAVGLLSALLWFGSTIVKVDHKRYVARLKAKDIENKGGHIINDNGSNLDETLKLQSKWNCWAAAATAVAMAFQAIAIALPDEC